MNNVLSRTERPAPISHELPKHNRPVVSPASERKARRAARNSRRSRIAAQRAMLDRAEYDLKNTTTGQALDIIEADSEVGGDVKLLVEEYTRARQDVLRAFPGRPAPSIRQRFSRAVKERVAQREAEEAQPEE